MVAQRVRSVCGTVLELPDQLAIRMPAPPKEAPADVTGAQDACWADRRAAVALRGPFWRVRPRLGAAIRRSRNRCHRASVLVIDRERGPHGHLFPESK